VSSTSIIYVKYNACDKREYVVLYIQFKLVGAVMKLFRRKSSATTNVPPEVAEYYQAERRDKTGMAWLMTLFALLVTVIIVLGLFLAGRWLYRTIRGNDVPTTTTTQTQDQGGSGNDQSGNGRTPTPPTESETERNESAPNSGGTNDERSEQSPENESSSEDNSSTSDRTPNDGPIADETTDELANTGPGETAATLFVIVAIGGYVARNYRLQRR
jgi:hypothetical protein